MIRSARPANTTPAIVTAMRASAALATRIFPAPAAGSRAASYRYCR
jgi:hypothetical protein